MGVGVVVDELVARAGLELEVGGLVDAAGDRIARGFERGSRVRLRVDVLGTDARNVARVTYEVTSSWLGVCWSIDVADIA